MCICSHFERTWIRSALFFASLSSFSLSPRSVSVSENVALRTRPTEQDTEQNCLRCNVNEKIVLIKNHADICSIYCYHSQSNAVRKNPMNMRKYRPLRGHGGDPLRGLLITTFVSSVVLLMTGKDIQGKKAFLIHLLLSIRSTYCLSKFTLFLPLSKGRTYVDREKKQKYAMMTVFSISFISAVGCRYLLLIFSSQ